MIRLLKVPKDENTSMTELLTEEFLNVDQQLLEITKSSMDVSGEYLIKSNVLFDFRYINQINVDLILVKNKGT